LGVFGAQGGSASAYFGANGGLGGEADATIAVTPGETIEITVGATGGALFYGGAAGGGASDIRTGSCAATLSCGLDDRIVVAGGGGGSGGFGTNWSEIDPGYWNPGDGGAGSGAMGLSGTNSYDCWSPGNGGTSTAGGAGGAGESAVPALSIPAGDGAAGTLGYGGAGGAYGSAAEGFGGAGGDGYYGGGGGGGNNNFYGGPGMNGLGCAGAGGGGGSGYITPDAITSSAGSGVESGDGQVVIELVQATPSSFTTTLTSPASNLVGNSWNDAATVTGNPYAGPPTGSVTFTLCQEVVQPTPCTGGTAVGTVSTSTASGGDASDFALLASDAQAPTVAGTYCYSASYEATPGGLYTSLPSAAAPECFTVQARPTLSARPRASSVTLGAAPVTLRDTAELSGGYNPTGTLTFTLYYGSVLVNTETVTVNGDGTYTTPTGYSLPAAGTVTGTWQWDVNYSGDTDNVAVPETNAKAERVTVSPAKPAIVATPGPRSVTLGTARVTLMDKAVLSGAYNPTGTITFTLHHESTLVDTETVTVSHNGTYTTPSGYSLPAMGTVAGAYQWDVSYSGDTDNAAVLSTNAVRELVTVEPGRPTLVATPSPRRVTLGTARVTLMDKAVLSGGYNPTGTITFTLYYGSTLVDTETVSVNGTGRYTTPTGYSLPTTGTVIGIYQWDVNYSGDPNNETASKTNTRGELVTVNA
jgi:hypothetical protein